MATIDLTKWRFIGGGSERKCYQNPNDPTRLIKLSPKKSAKQTLREIAYFQYLIDHNVPFDHIPRFYGAIKEEQFIGIEQELILASPKSTEPAPNIGQYISKRLSKDQIIELHRALIQLKDYLIRWHIVLCDLQISNIVIQRKEKGIHLMLIDGLGGTELIPLSRWFISICHKKTNKYWKKLCRKITRANPDITF